MTKGAQHYKVGEKVNSHQKLLNEIIDVIGEASATAQKLPKPVTNSTKFFSGKDRIYCLVDGFKILGMMKVGKKKLFIRDEVGNISEIEPLCVLDFYVHESCQRIGYGKFIFETMCQNEKIEPHKMGYDRPSVKLLSFLKKYYGLETYTQQVNNFVVFNSYFIGDKSFKAYYKDPIKPRGKLEPPKSNDNSRGHNPYQNQYGFGQGATPNYNDKPVGKMPAYKDLRKIVDKPGQPQDMNQYAEYDYNSQEVLDNQRRVRFSEDQPQVYQQENNYDTNQIEYYDQNPGGKGASDVYMDTEDYIAPAGKFYMNPKIELDQYERKFNRTKTDKFEGKETVKELFSHPESDGPLDATNYKKMQIPIDYEIK